MRFVLLGLSRLAIIAVASVPLLGALGQEAGPGKRPETVSFSMDVFPIFKGRCVDCHQPGGTGYETSGLDLTSHEGLMKGTKFGPMVIPGDTVRSNLLRVLDWQVSSEIQMPHGAARRLSTCDRTTIRTWVWEGARNN
jgi:hypothetical protein